MQMLACKAMHRQRGTDQRRIQFIQQQFTTFNQNISRALSTTRQYQQITWGQTSV